MVSDGTNVTGAYSTDGTTWTPVGRPAPLPGGREDRPVRVHQRGGGNPGRGLRLVPPREARRRRRRRHAVRPELRRRLRRRVAGQDALERDRARQPGRVRRSAGGNLTSPPSSATSTRATPTRRRTTSSSSTRRSRRRGLGDRDQAVGSTINGGYAQGGLIAYVDGDNYVKFDADLRRRQHADQPRSSCARRSPASIQEPPGRPAVAAGSGTTIWLRLTKAGTNYTGEYSFDGTTWTAGRRRPVAEPDGGAGLRPVRVRPAGGGRRRHRVVRLLHARRARTRSSVRACTRPRRRVRRHRARHDEVERDRPRRPDEVRGRRRRAEGHHRRRRHLHQRRPGRRRATSSCRRPTTPGTDYVLETKVDATQLNGGYAQGGILVRGDDDNYVKFDAISDDNNTTVQPDRAALRGRRARSRTRSRSSTAASPAGVNGTSGCG